jgi:leucyl-tRNA synthetase
VPEKDLPVKLPDVERYEPTDTGESPLAHITDWVNTECPQCDGAARRETDTMPNWAGSSWYFLRYADPRNDEEFADQDLMKYWLPVDVYNGGMEHTTLHLLYSRFWNQFLHDQGLVPMSEPYSKRTSHGMVLGEGGIKMSKSRGNVVNPDGIVEEYGADTLRVYEMFIGPFSDAAVWSTASLIGAHRFLRRVWDCVVSRTQNPPSPPYQGGTTAQNPPSPPYQGGNDDELNLMLQRTVRRVTEGIEKFSFNTAVAAMMEMLNEMEKRNEVSKDVLETYVLLLSSFAPHISEELWQQLGHKDSVLRESWPQADEEILKKAAVTMPVQVNGKVRGTLQVEPGTEQADVEQMARKLENVKRHLEGNEIKKVVYVPDRLINFVL